MKVNPERRGDEWLAKKNELYQLFDLSPCDCWDKADDKDDIEKIRADCQCQTKFPVKEWPAYVRAKRGLLVRLESLDTKETKKNQKRQREEENLEAQRERVAQEQREQFETVQFAEDSDEEVEGMEISHVSEMDVDFDFCDLEGSSSPPVRILQLSSMHAAQNTVKSKLFKRQYGLAEFLFKIEPN